MPFVDGPTYIDGPQVDYTAKESLAFNNEVIEDLWSLDMSAECFSKGEIANKDVVKQSIRNILYTMPGERLFNLDYGVNLYQYIFDTYAEIGEIKSEMVRVLLRYEPRVELTVRDIEVTVDPTNNSVHLDLTYYIKDSKEIDALKETLFL
jgi:phage baseplate assembly protein W